MSKGTTHAQIVIDNYSVKIIEKNNSIDNPTAFDYVFIVVHKYKKDDYGYVNISCEWDKISKDDADSILNDLGNWEKFIFISQNLLRELGFNNFEITECKEINQEEIQYDEKCSKDTAQVYRIEKNRIHKKIAEEDITHVDIVRAFTNIVKWRKLSHIKSFFLK